MHEFRVEDIAHAGEHLLDELNSRGWSQAEFAGILGRPVQFVSEIINGKKEITRESAAQIGAAFGTSPEYWLQLQDGYYLAQQRSDSESAARLESVRRRASLRANFPISLLAQRGLVHPTDPQRQEQDILRLYKISSLDERPEFALAARRSNATEPMTQLQEAWFVSVRDKAERHSAGVYDETSFRELASSLPQRIKSPRDFESLPALFAAAGVKLVHIDTFPTSKLDGCAFVIDGTPVIGLTGRGKRLDKVFFTLLHEAAHILLGHVGSTPIVDETDAHNGPETNVEDAANSLAARWSFGDGLPAAPARIGEAWVASVADSVGIHPLMVVGHLQHEGVLNWRTSLVRGAPTVTEALRTWS